MKPRPTWRSRYPGFGWSVGPDRTTRTVTAVAAAGLVGTVIGGFSAFGVFSALPPPPRPEVAAGPRVPIRTVYGVVPDPSAGMTAAAPVQAPAVRAQPAQLQSSLPPQRQPATSVQAQTSSPPSSLPQQAAPAQASVLSPEQGQSPQMAPEQNAPESANKEDATTTDSYAVATQTTMPPEPQRRSYGKKRVAITKPPQTRPVYDYFWSHAARGWRDNDAARDDAADAKGAALSGMNPPHGARAARVAKSRYVRSRQQPDYRRDSSEERDRGGGFFLGRDNWRDNNNW